MIPNTRNFSQVQFISEFCSQQTQYMIPNTHNFSQVQFM
jgi:hypothetical protein